MDGAALMAGGFAMGLAGILHCSCVCGGIASSLLLVAGPPEAARSSQMRALGTIQAGKALTYVASANPPMNNAPRATESVTIAIINAL